MATTTRNPRPTRGVKTEPVADSAPSDEPRKDAQDHDEIQGSDPVGSSLVEAFAEALNQDETGDLRNDAVESQVVDGIGGNEASPATPGGTPGTAREAPAAAETGGLRNDAVESQIVDGIGGNEAIPATPDRTSGTAREALAPAETGDLRNDAVESQVVHGIGGNEASSAAQGSTSGTGPPLSDVDREAIRAHYAQSVARTQEQMKDWTPPGFSDLLRDLGG